MEDFPSWQQGIRKEYAPLRGIQHTDVAIIGGGLTGVTCALMLASQGVSTIVLEAGRLAQGGSWACTGKVTSQLGGIYQTVADTISEEAASVYARLMREAVHGVRSLVEKHQLRCGLEDQDVYVFAETSADLPPLRKLLDLESRLGLSVTAAPDAGGCPFPVEQSTVVRGQLLLSPVPYVLGMAEAAAALGCQIHEESPVREISGGRLTTPGGSVEASVIVLATGSPIGCKKLTTLAMMQQRTCQVAVMQGEPLLHASHLSILSDEMTLRPIHGGALMAWDMGRTGAKEHVGRQTILRRTQKALLPDMRQVDSIIRQDTWSGDGLPLIGALHGQDSHLLIATGYSGWGVANAYLAGRLLTGQIMGRPLPEAPLFRPDRSYHQRLKVIARGGIKTGGAYLAGLARPSAPVCPHMSGKLRYNHEAARWECPCHGSAFATLGETLEGPAMRNASVSAKQRDL